MWIFLGIIQFSFALLVKAGGGGNHADHNIFCLTSQCNHDEVCRLHNTNGHLNGQCINKHNEPYKADRDGCPHFLGKGHECFCNNNDCVQQTQAATGQHTVTTTNHNDLVCGDHVCHGHQYCLIEEKNDGKLHLKCADVHNTQHCLPNLLSLGSSCFCDTRTCVDHTLISIVAGHHVAGLICSDHDDHSCHADHVCEISIDKNGIKKHCGKGDHITQCTQLPINLHEKCYCTTQSCVFGQFSAPTSMSTTSKLTTSGPIIAASTTIPQTTVQPTTTQPTMVQLTTAQPTMVQPTTAQPTMVQPTTVQPNTSVATTGISTSKAATSIPTTTVVTSVTSSSNNICTDDEDINFSCVVYEMKYGLCNATTGTLFNIAQKRCQAFCGICAGNNTSGTPPASLPTQPTCIDHDARCSQYQQQICSATVSQNYVISTCPKSCNKCAEYLAVTTPTPIKCNTCGDISNGIPCYSKDVYGNSSTTICPTGHNYCMTDVLNDGNGNSDVFKRCVTQQTCDTKWLKESADQDYCMRYGVVTNANAFECHFCCSGDQCNIGIKPATSTLLSKTSG